MDIDCFRYTCKSNTSKLWNFDKVIFCSVSNLHRSLKTLLPASHAQDFYILRRVFVDLRTWLVDTVATIFVTRKIVDSELTGSSPRHFHFNSKRVVTGQDTEISHFWYDTDKVENAIEKLAVRDPKMKRDSK
jgi:hypothetical protein